MDIDLYSKSVEELMTERDLTVACISPQKYGQRFKAYGTGTTSGEGETPREAIIDLYKKLK